MRIGVLMLSALMSLWIDPARSQTDESHGHRASEAVGRSAGAFGRLMSAAMDKMHHDMAAAPQTGDADRDHLEILQKGADPRPDGFPALTGTRGE